MPNRPKIGINLDALLVIIPHLDDENLEKIMESLAALTAEAMKTMKKRKRVPKVSVLHTPKNGTDY